MVEKIGPIRMWWAGLKLDIEAYLEYKYRGRTKLEFIRSVLHTLNRFIRFAVVGILTVPIGLGSLWLLTDVLGVYYLVSNVIAFCLSTLVWFILHSIWTFGKPVGFLQGYGKSLVVRLVVLGTTTGTLALFVEVFNLWYVLGAIIAFLVALPVSYTLSIVWIWRKSHGA